MIRNLKLTPKEVEYLKSKRIGLVLSGGASRGFAEVGAMSVFEKHSIRPEFIVGCSVGSLVGTCVAAGKSTSLLESEFLEHKPFTWRDVSIFKHSGLLNPEHIVKKILDTLDVHTFADLQIPFVFSGTNLSTGKEKVFSKGPLLPALCSSIAFPGVVAPRKIGKSYYVDGGVTTPIPVHLLPNNLDLIIIVDVTGKVRALGDRPSTFALLRNVYEIMLHHISNRDLKKILLERDAILIQPPVDSFGLFNFNSQNAKKMINAGETTARKALKSGIRRLKAKENRLRRQEEEQNSLNKSSA